MAFDGDNSFQNATERDLLRVIASKLTKIEAILMVAVEPDDVELEQLTDTQDEDNGN